MSNIETTRRTSSLIKVLERLEQGSALNTELNPIAFRYGARIEEMRKLGYAITTERVSRGLYRYTLVSKPVQTAAA